MVRVINRLVTVDAVGVGQVEAVLSVDQRDTLIDKPARLSNSGMLVRPSSSTTFHGWRRDDGTVREFVFGAPDLSIAAQATGKTAGVGVIGVAVFRKRERTVYPSYGGFEGSFEAMRSPVTMGDGLTKGGGATRSANLGTGAGSVVSSNVSRVRFERSSAAPQIIVIGYNTEEWLREQGLMIPAEPEPFLPEPSQFDQYAPMR